MNLRQYLAKATVAAVVIGCAMGIGARLAGSIPDTESHFTWETLAYIVALVALMQVGTLSWVLFRLPRVFPARTFRIPTTMFAVLAAAIMVLVALCLPWHGNGSSHELFLTLWLPGWMMIWFGGSHRVYRPHEIDIQLYRERITRHVYDLIWIAFVSNITELRLTPVTKPGRTTPTALLAEGYVRGKLRKLESYPWWQGELILDYLRALAQEEFPPEELYPDDERRQATLFPVALRFPTVLPPREEALIIGIGRPAPNV